jgi:large subunit ribosomal protein L6
MVTLNENIEVPENVEIAQEDLVLIVKGEKGTLSRLFSHPKIKINFSDKNIKISCISPRRRDRALIGTFAAHIKNMIKGVSEGFEYKMKTVYSHFPVKTIIEKDEVVIQNFLGERSARRAKIIEGVTIEINGDDLIVRGIDKEKVGQTVANIERATAVKYRDIRVFQDGIYRTSKGES